MGIDVDPDRVRLLTSPNDPYTWGHVPGNENSFKPELFNNHLSKLSVGPLTELYREVGSSFRAVLRTTVRISASPQAGVQEVERLHDKGQNIARKLQKKIRKLKKENKRWEAQARQQKKLLETYKHLAERILEASPPSM